MPRDTAIGIDPQTGEVVYIPANVQEAALRGAGQGAMESNAMGNIGRMVGGAAHALTAPLRGVSAVAHNVAGVGDRMDVSDAMLYGRDMDTGQAPTPYGTALRRVVMGEEQAGDEPTGFWADKAADVMEFAGNLISDPLALGAGVSAASRLGAGAGGTSPAAARQIAALSDEGAVKAAPKPKIKFTGEALDTDLAGVGTQNRVYSFPNQMRQARASTSPGQLKKVAPGAQRRPGAGYPEDAPTGDAAREAMIREGFMDPSEGVPSQLLDTDLVRWFPATSRLRASELADYLQRTEARRGPGGGLGPGAAGAGERLAPASGTGGPLATPTLPRNPGLPGNMTEMRGPGVGPVRAGQARFNIPAEEAGATTTANQMLQTRARPTGGALEALLEALQGFVE